MIGTILNTYALPTNFFANQIAIDANGDVWVATNSPAAGYAVAEIVSAAAGPQYFPYSSPQYPY